MRKSLSVLKAWRRLCAGALIRNRMEKAFAHLAEKTTGAVCFAKGSDKVISRRFLRIGMMAAGLITGIAFAGAALPAKAREILPQQNPYSAFLVPTQLTFFEGRFFLTDCYHDRVLIAREAGTPPRQWQVMDAAFDDPHAVAFDGQIYLVVDTEHNSVVTYRRRGEVFEELQRIGGVGTRPHYVVWQDGIFYVWSSMTGEMYLFARDELPGSFQIHLQEVKALPNLLGSYVRSFLIEDDRIYLPCVNLKCICAVDKESFALKEVYPVPDEVAGIVQIVKIEDMYYITVSTDSLGDHAKACFIRTPSLAALSDPQTGYEVITGQVGGVPYYLTSIGNSWYGPVPRGDGRSTILRFDVFMHKIFNVKEYTF